MSAAAQIAVFILLLALSAVSLAQPVDLRQAPPPIAFPDWRRIEGPPEAEEFALEFPSSYTTPYPVNNVVPLQVLLPVRRTGPVPVVVILHYWGAVDLRVERSIASELNSRGVAAVLVSLPYHLIRTPAGSRSGAMAIEPEPEKLIRTMTQCVLDVRRTIDWIHTRPEFDVKRIGLAGTSLGGIVASLVAAIDPRLDAAAFVLGGVDLAHIMWRSSRVVVERDRLRNRGYTEDRLRQELTPIEPANFYNGTRPRHAFIVGAKYDTVVPAAATEKLADLYPNAAKLWLDTGHYGGFFIQKRVHHEVALFFAKSFAGEAYVPPLRVSAPTVRIGVSIAPDTELQVVAGLDLWRGDAEGNTFASFQIAPRGAQLFVGHRLDRGLAVGLFARTRRITGGIFWSTVL